MSLIAVGALYSAAAYVEDVVLRPEREAQQAIKFARGRGQWYRCERGRWHPLWQRQSSRQAIAARSRPQLPAPR